jgi:hypothetical protein
MKANLLHPPADMRNIEVAPVFSDHPVRFGLVTTLRKQFVAYYNHKGWLTVAQRDADSTKWETMWVDSKVGWDSHNFVTLAMDDGGHLHMAHNMHNTPLRYMRSQKPFDITTMVKWPMIGRDETACTYPKFMHTKEGKLIFTYRQGTCGNGVQVMNILNGHTWERLPNLFDGEGSANAYFVGPGRHGEFAYTWRTSPDPRSNRDVCYIQTDDFHTWRYSDGTEAFLPLTRDNSEVVDFMPEHSGLLNGNMAVGGTQHMPVVSYHKFDEEGNTQLYNARWNGANWKTYQVSNWDFRWDFQGKGCIPLRVKVHPAIVANINGWGRRLFQNYRYRLLENDCWQYGCYVIDPLTMKPIATTEWQRPKGWRLHWNKLDANYDMPRAVEAKPSMLKVIYDE